MDYLAFEKPIEELTLQLEKAQGLAEETGVDMSKSVEELQKTFLPQLFQSADVVNTVSQ